MMLAIIQHEEHLGMGFLGELLRRRGLEWTLFRPDRGQALPSAMDGCSGLILLDGERAALDPMPWMQRERALCESALAAQRPVLGLGLGAQVLTLALGGGIRPLSSLSYGWVPSWLTPVGAQRYGGQVAGLEVFNAHGHALDLPTGAQCVLFDKRCANKGYVQGPHLALMSPLHLTPACLQTWCGRKNSRLSTARGPDVQNRVAMLRALPERFRAQQALAERLLSGWMDQLHPQGSHPALRAA